MYGVQIKNLSQNATLKITGSGLSQTLAGNKSSKATFIVDFYFGKRFTASLTLS
jgi:hypothetical protein